jgi:hypothetical protein
MTESSEAAPPKKRSPLPIAVLLIAGGVVILVALFAVQLLSILYAILFPPLPPLPASVTSIRHSSVSYGVDEWLYTADAEACAVFLFYQPLSQDCPLLPAACENITPEEPLLPRTHIAQCSGSQYFSLFAMRWSVNIAAAENDGTKTIFSLMREVFWGGQIPPSMDDIINQIEQP